MFKGVKVFVASLFAMLLCAMPASAISFSSLEQISEPTDNIEINTPEDGYAFDVNFLAKNQELKYKTTLTNDESLPIKIESIDLDTSSYNFLEYSYDGISADDTIETGATRDLTISVGTNSNDTPTVSVDYNLTINYSQVQPEPDPDPIPDPDPDPTPDPDEPDVDKPENPETATTAVVKTGTIALISIGAITFVFVRNKKIRNCIVLFVATSLGVCLLASTATAEGDTSTYTIRGKVRFTNIYTVTVDPNEGTYAGDLQVTRREGESYHIEDVSREHFSFVEWEINPNNTPDENNNIEIHANTTLKAKWNEKTYTLTINPNGGEYLDSESVWSQSYRPGQSASISAPVKEGYDFKYWTVEEGSIGQDGRFSGNSVTMNENITLVAYYEIQKYTVTIVPNGGSYAGSLTATVDWNTDYEIQSIARDGYDLKNWTKTNSDGTATLSADTQTVNIKSNTTLTANWWSSTFYTVTIDPNGGTYAGDLETQVRADETYTMQTVAKENYVLSYWHYTDTDTHMDDESFVVNSNISLTAEWTFPVARIESTQKLYPSIMAAHEEAESGDTITLLVNDAEIVTNSKNITLDLNQHTVYGYLNNTRSGNITLLNGEINNYDTPAEGTYYQTGSAADYSAPIIDDVNPSGAAVVNAGTLTMGINDYQDAAMNEKVPLINNQYVRLIGSSIGLDQNGHFYFYDGFIEGTIGLKGGYDGSPWYRETFDGTVVNYFPFVTKNTIKNCQHVELSNADKAVSKTIDNGPIYYYNLQDNINTSTLTGYQIYAVRDFDGSYAITVDNGADITFDIIGYTVNLGEDVTVDGKLTVLDSAETKGLLTSSKTIQNNGELVIRDMTLSAMTTNTLLQNNNSLTLQNATITSDKGTTLYLPNQEVTLSLDNNSYIITESNQPALINDSPSTTISAGTISGKTCTVKNNSGKTFTLEDGTITGEASAVCNYGGTFTMNNGLVSTEYNGVTKAIYTPWDYSGSELNINGGKVSVRYTGTLSYAHIAGIYTETSNDTVNVSGGEIDVVYDSTGYSTVSGIYAYSTLNITGGHIKVTSRSTSNTFGVNSGRDGNLTIDGANVIIEAHNTESSATTNGARQEYGETHLKRGTIISTSKNGNTLGFHNDRSTVYVEDDMSISSHSETQNAYGIWHDEWSYPGTINMAGGNISATTDASDKLGIGLMSRYITVTGGTVYGSSYGINGAIDNNNTTITLGVNEPPLYNGVYEDDEGNVYPATPEIKGGVYGISNGNVYFYDGILKGGSLAYFDRNIKAIADNTYVHGSTETIDGKVYQVRYLANKEVLAKIGNTEYYSLQAAVDAANDGDEIDLVADNYIFEQLNFPANKTISVDFNGFEVVTGNQVINNGNVTLFDSSNGAKLLRYAEANWFITNEANASLTINGIDIQSRFAIYNKANGTATLKNLAIGKNFYSETAIENYGNLNLDNVEIHATNRAVYTTGGNFNIQGSDLYVHPYDGNSNHYAVDNNNGTGSMTSSTISVMDDQSPYIQHYENYKFVYNQTGNDANVNMNQTTFNGYARIINGKFTFINGTMTQSESQVHRNYPLLYNTGTSIIDSSSVQLTQNERGVYDWSTVIDNAGTLTVKNSTTVKHVLVNDANRAISRIYYSTGTLTIENARINQEYMNVPSNIGTGMGDTYGIYNTGTVNYTNSTIDLGHRNTWGIYAESGNVNIYSGTVKVGGSNNAFALWAKSGAITLGEAEPTDSPNYGTANANVSTTSPNITAIGDNLGIGVTLENGSFNFYDGKITQSSTVGPAVQADHVTRATVTNVEYLYQPETYADTSGHTYFILEFMR